jgi:gamma-glutamyltranspeptidase
MHSMFNILSHLLGYNFTSQDVANDSATASAYHKIIETFRYAYARRALLGDKNFATNASKVSPEWDFSVNSHSRLHLEIGLGRLFCAMWKDNSA